MLKMFRYLKPYWWQVIILLASIGTQVWMVLQLPAIMATIVNDGIMKGDTGYIFASGLKMVVLAIVASLFALLANYLSARVGMALARDLRDDLFKHILSFSIADIDDFSTASLIVRTTNDISQVQQAVVMCLTMLIRAPITAVLAIGQAIATAPDMTWIIALAVAVLLVAVVTIIAIVMPKFEIIQKLNDRITLLTRENLTGLRVIRAFNNESVEKRRFERTNDETTKLAIWIDLIMSLQDPIITIVMNGTAIMCVWIGVSLMTTNIDYLGNMIAFMQYAVQVIMSFLFLTLLFVILPRANVSAKRINAVLERKPKITWLPETIGKPALAPSVEFEKVGFSYANAEEKVLTDISFVAEAGKTTAFIGSTGSGKSTLINLVPRFYEATTGKVKINGIDVKDYAQKDLMRRIGYVPQRGILFAGTVKSNIMFGAPEISEAEIHRAARIAQAEEFIEK